MFYRLKNFAKLYQCMLNVVSSVKNSETQLNKHNAEIKGKTYSEIDRICLPTVSLLN